MQMTNGDMIKTMFPDVEVKEKNNGYEVYFGIGTAIQYFNYQWWNTSYKAERKVCICTNCKKWDECPCGKEGHINGTSIGYSIGECKDYEPSEETRELLTADERALFLNKLTHWLNDNFNDIVIGGWQDNDGEIFDLFFIRRDKND